MQRLVFLRSALEELLKVQKKTDPALAVLDANLPPMRPHTAQ